MVLTTAPSPPPRFTHLRSSEISYRGSVLSSRELTSLRIKSNDSFAILDQSKWKLSLHFSWSSASYYLLSLLDQYVKSPSISADEDVTLSGFKEKFKTYVIVDSSGGNKWMSPATFKSSCDMLVTYYPFDKQSCEMTFGSWTFDNRLLKMVSKSNKHSHAGWCD